MYQTKFVSLFAPNGAVIEIELDFIERLKNRVTLTTDFTVDDAMRSPNPVYLDADIHIAGRSPDIELRLVAEVKNAASAQQAMALIYRAESTHAALRVTGVWRMWPEHAIGPEIQGERVPPLTTPNADHLFELHPLLRVAGVSLLETLRPVEGYKPGAAKRSFGIWENADCTLKLNPHSVVFFTSNWLYNDVNFLLRPGGDILDVADGGFVTADALDDDGTVLVRGLRAVLIRGSAADRAVRRLPRGRTLHVWGIPRVSFAEVSRRIAAARTHPEVLKGSLPYEIIVLGVYSD